MASPRIYGPGKGDCPGEMPGVFRMDVFGIALNLEEDQVGAVLLGEYTLVSGKATRSSARARSCRAPVGEAMVGRVVSPLGLPLDGKGAHRDRQSASRSNALPRASWTGNRCASPLQTGIKSIDSMIPIGRGQRELIIGDRQTGQDRQSFWTRS